MRETIDAVYESGVFRPLSKPAVADGQKVRLVVDTQAGSPDLDPIDLAADVYKGLSEEQIAQVEEAALDRKHFFRNDGS